MYVSILNMKLDALRAQKTKETYQAIIISDTCYIHFCVSVARLAEDFS